MKIVHVIHYIQASRLPGYLKHVRFARMGPLPRFDQRNSRIFRLGSALLVLVLVSGQAAGARPDQDYWLIKGHDVRRTGQSANLGPVAIDEGMSWSMPAPGGMVLNVGASVDERGAYVGSWGLLRRTPGNPDPRSWDKSDGKVFAYALETGDPLWVDHARLDLVPRCYDYMDRGPDLYWCGLTPYTPSFYNGTVEGQAAIDPLYNRIYVGRGDGRLYALDRDTGEIAWRFVTFNPEDPADPDGGGEIVSSPLVGPDGNVYFGTWGEGDYETNAFYAVNRAGELLWRYPSAESLSHRIFASAALSPDTSTLYVSTFRDDGGVLPGTLFAFNRLPAGATSEASRLKWSIDLSWLDLPVQTATLAVGSDGTVFVGGLIPEVLGVAVIAAFTDMGDHAAYAWHPAWVELRDNAQFTLGIALREEAGETTIVFASTANLGTALFNAKTEGTLYALDPSDGRILGSYDPSDDVPEAVGGINSPAVDAAGRIFFGVRGRYGGNAINGHYFGVTFDPATGAFFRLWNYEVDGYIEWSHAAIGPDGGIYVGSSENEDTDQIRTVTYDDGVIPEGSSPLFYALKGPQGVRAEPTPPVPGADLVIAAYPNPFANEVSIRIDPGAGEVVEVVIVDLVGRAVRSFALPGNGSSAHTIRWDGRTDAGIDAAPGVYLVRAVRSRASGDRSFGAVEKLVKLARQYAP